MQNDYFSDSQSEDSQFGTSALPALLPVSHQVPLPTMPFEITPQDTEILQQYLEEFQEADKAHRTNLVQKIMGELYQHRAVDATFDKMEASEVCAIYAWLLNSFFLTFCFRR